LGVLFGLHAEKITNRCPPASPACHRLLVIAPKSYAAMAMAGRPELATRLPSPGTAYSPNAGMRGNGGQVAGRLREPFTRSLPGALKEGEYSGISTAVTAS